MRLDDAFRLLDLPTDASDDDVKRAWRDLTKVWHPDRFGHDPDLRLRAEEKSKAINEAFETVRAARERAAARGEEDGRAGPQGDGRGPEPAAAAAGRRVRSNLTRALLAAGAAVFLLLRRPTPAGLVMALALLGVGLVFLWRMRAAAREGEAASLPRPEA